MVPVSQHDAIQSNIKYDNVSVTGIFLPRLTGVWPCCYCKETGAGAEMVRTPVLDREDEMLSGLMEAGNVKAWENVLPWLLASTITLLSTVLMTRSSGLKLSTFTRILYWSPSQSPVCFLSVNAGLAGLQSSGPNIEQFLEQHRKTGQKGQ